MQGSHLVESWASASARLERPKWWAGIRPPTYLSRSTLMVRPRAAAI